MDSSFFKVRIRGEEAAMLLFSPVRARKTRRGHRQDDHGRLTDKIGALMRVSFFR